MQVLSYPRTHISAPGQLRCPLHPGKVSSRVHPLVKAGEQAGPSSPAQQSDATAASRAEITATEPSKESIAANAGAKRVRRKIKAETENPPQQANQGFPLAVSAAVAAVAGAGILVFMYRQFFSNKARTVLESTSKAVAEVSISITWELTRGFNLNQRGS